ncbi:MAG: hypothetical protein CSB34_02230 [Desulfobulbus propionicus]|nr:MAG: hypothetical protein CSB34_02230 [Desulfobulbus propionicus]
MFVLCLYHTSMMIFTRNSFPPLFFTEGNLHLTLFVGQQYSLLPCTNDFPSITKSYLIKSPNTG